MIVQGDESALFNAVRLDTFENANKGTLLSADDMTGIVIYRDASGEDKRVECGMHAIKILPRGRR